MPVSSKRRSIWVGNLYGLLAVAALCVVTACSSSTVSESEAALSQANTEHLYQSNCASCHDQPFYKAPSRSLLSGLSPVRILEAMTDGPMQAQAAVLSSDQKVAVAEYISGRSIEEFATKPLPPQCGAEERFDPTKMPVSQGWGVDERNSRFQPFESGGLNAENVSELELKWSFAYPNAFQARSQPVYGGGAVFVGSHDGTVWALGARTGCLLWSFQARAEVRTGIAISQWTPSKDGEQDPQPLIFFGDTLANVYALDARSGELKWQRKADNHAYATLTGTPTYYNKRLYVPVSSLEVIAAGNPEYACCTFQGSVLALEADTGKQVWKSHTTDEAPKVSGKTSEGTDIMAPSGAPIWSAPTIDAARNRLYVGTGENYSSPADGNSDAIMAFDLATGRKLWVSQQTEGDAWNVACFDGIPGMNRANCPEENGPDYDFGSHVILQTLNDGTEVLLGGQKSGDIVGIDPETGVNRWKTRIGRGGVQGGVHFGIAAEGNTVYAPINDLIFPGDDQRYALYNKQRKPAPGVHALSAQDGRLLWSSDVEDVCADTEYCTPGVSQAIAAIPGAVIAGFLDGRLRIFAKRDGRLLWEKNTLGQHPAVNGISGTGGAFSGGGVLVANGLLYVNSGYGFNLHMPGNTLMVFGLP